MPVSDCELTQMFEHVLTLSKVDPTQSVAVLKSHYSDPRTARAAMDVAEADERALRRQIAAVEQRAQGFLEARAVARDGEADRLPPPRLVIAGVEIERLRIGGLRGSLVTHQIESQRLIGQHLARGNAGSAGAIELRDRLARPPGTQIDRAKAQREHGEQLYGYITILSTLALFAFVPHYGSWLDRHSRKTAMLAAEVSSTGCG